MKSRGKKPKQTSPSDSPEKTSIKPPLLGKVTLDEGSFSSKKKKKSKKQKAKSKKQKAKSKRVRTPRLR
jgi:hypothetical protein